MWYYVKDPNYFDLKSPRRWNPAGVKLHAPRPFYNREDGHFLLNNTCTIANLCLMPELRRLQCYFFSKLPKVHVDRNFYLPMKKHGRQHTRWRWMETWKRQLIPWCINSTPRILKLPHLEHPHRGPGERPWPGPRRKERRTGALRTVKSAPGPVKVRHGWEV